MDETMRDQAGLDHGAVYENMEHEVVDETMEDQVALDH